MAKALKHKVKPARVKKPKYKLSAKKGLPSTYEFWYDLTDGEYLQAEDFSDDPATIRAIKDAVKLIKRCEKLLCNCIDPAENPMLYYYSTTMSGKPNKEI